ncbi:phosphoglycerate mutase-like protein [Venturia nashicola]|nr:phosphoglycerate mutase-like protein [Venturia nashicola]
MRLFLVRHGETVDNVAGVYAGSRDSDLTNHGYLQATRLGEYFKSEAVKFTHIFSSQLKRAVKTARLIREAQPTSIEIRQTPLIMEQDFGFYEGKHVFARPQKGNPVSGKEAHRTLHKDDEGFVDIESKEAVALRADAFLNEHLLPVMEENNAIAVVSHGIMLSALWRRLLQRLPAKSVMIHPEVIAVHGQLDLERPGGWSNTGYLELDMSLSASCVTAGPLPAPINAIVEANLPEEEIVALAPPFAADKSTVGESSSGSGTRCVPIAKSTSSDQSFTAWTTMIRAVNHKAHLNNLKRTRGGVGSSRHDEKQKSINSFFKKQKRE